MSPPRAAGVSRPVATCRGCSNNRPANAGRSWLTLLICLTLTSTGVAKETLVHNVAEFDAAVKDAKPGDKIVLANGEWRDAELVCNAQGSEDGIIRILPENNGKVVFTGNSRLRIGGRHIIVGNLLWKGVSSTDDVVSFRTDAKTLAENCWLYGCAIVDDDPATERKWVSMYGRNNVVNYCRFERKQSSGTLLVVWLDDRPAQHLIAYNFFGRRERLGKNGGEIIRIGDSKTSLQTSRTRVQNNYFYRCDGEAEIISNKSCENNYALNAFVGCSGALTLRHGNRCVVVGNYFIGDGRNGTGGVRVIGEDHAVARNVFDGLTGDKARAALSLMNGIPDSPLHGYFQVKRAVVQKNLFVNCEENIVIGLRDDDQKKQVLPPQECEFRENVVVAKSHSVFVRHSDPAEFSFAGNMYDGEELNLGESAGWSRTRLDLEFFRNEFGFLAMPNFIDVGTRNIALPRLVGPAWMRPGDEYLPEVLKKK